MRPFPIAATAAAEMCWGVGWSGSPTLKSSTSAPFALRAAARWAIAIVGETSMARARRERSAAEPSLLTSPSGAAEPPRSATARTSRPAPLDHGRDSSFTSPPSGNTS